MDPELKQHLNDLNRRFDELKQYIDAKFATKEDLERVETSLLTAFHQWASPTESRARAHTATLNTLELEIFALKDRVKKLEERPN